MNLLRNIVFSYCFKENDNNRFKEENLDNEKDITKDHKVDYTLNIKALLPENLIINDYMSRENFIDIDKSNDKQENKKEEDKNENESILIGLNNLEASYMNATLQCLSNTENLTNYFLNNYPNELNIDKKAYHMNFIKFYKIYGIKIIIISHTHQRTLRKK